MKVLVVTQRIEEDHDVLGFFVGWVAAMARRFEVEVVAQSVGPHSLSGVRVHSLGKEKGLGRWRQAMRLQRRLSGAVLRRDVDVIFCHMCPEYVLPCVPIARLGRVPLVLWYTHGTGGRWLSVAQRLVHRVVTAAPADYPLACDRLQGLGHGIDTARFRRSPMPPPGSRFEILSVGRLSPVKGHDVVIEALAELVHARGRGNVLLRILGGAPIADHEPERRRLEALVRDRELSGHVEMIGPVAHSRVASWIERSHLFVSASSTGSLDKAVLEAMSCGRPVVTSDPAFRVEVSGMEADLMFRPGDSSDLADKLERLVDRSPTELEQLGTVLSSRVAERHELEAFIGRLEAVFQSCRDPEVGDSGA